MNKQLIYTVLGMLMLSMFGGMASSQQVVKVESAVPVVQTFDSQNFTML